MRPRAWLTERFRRLRLMARLARETWIYGKPLVPPSRILVARWPDALTEGPDGRLYARQRVRVLVEAGAPMRVAYVGSWPEGHPLARALDPGDHYHLRINMPEPPCPSS